MKPRTFLSPLAIVFAATTFSVNAQLLLTEIQSDGLSDYWELTNTGASAVDLSNWKWDDDSQNPNDAAAVTIPSGTSIAAGESIIFTSAANANTFRTQWGLSNSVQVITGGPGFGQDDGVALFNASNVKQFYFTYASGGFTRPDGSSSTGGHAGISAGGTAAKALVWNPASGTSSPRYTYATGTTLGTFTAPGGSTNIGSPGFSGYTTGGGPQITLSLSATSTTFSESASNPASTGTVTRALATPDALVVNLTSSDTTEATVPATVTIPANQTSVTFPITAVNDTFPDGGKTAIITATATDATSPTLSLTVQDDGDTLDTAFLLTEIQSNQSANKPSGADDYWELTNTSAVSRDISGYSWHDNGRSGAAAQAYKLPSGTTIAAGESVVFTSMAPAAFRAWWGIPNTVQVFQSIGAPGLGKDDGISFFDPGQNELFFFSYAAAGFTKADGNPSVGGHAGASAGGSADSQALVWVPTSGTASPRYTFATGSNYATFSAVSPATDLGSPGSQGVVTENVAIADASITEGNSGTSTVSLNVTRSSTSTAFTVNYAVTGGTATTGNDYATLASGTLTFTNGGAATQPIQIQVNGDTTPEPDETIIVTLSNVVNTTGTTVLANSVGTATIINDDQILPAITTQPVGTTVASGSTTTLTVAASGFPAPTFQWYIGNSGDTSQPISGATSATLVTPAINANTRFWARATNSAGSADSSAALVTIVSGVTSIDLSSYVRVARYALPEPILTALPAGTPSSNYLCQEASGVTYNWDTDTLFIVGDGGRSVTQVSKTGVLIDTMTLALGGSPQGTEFYDTEGITYLGNGEFAFTEERDRQIVKFTYAAGTTLTRSATKTVKLGTFVNNTGLEGFSWDPQTGGFIIVKEISPMGIFQTGIDFNAGTATNGSPTTINSTDLFDPNLLGMSDFADVFALSNLPSVTGHPQAGNLLVLSQESARIVNTDRSGNITSSLQIVADSGDTLSVADMQHEGLTMDRAGNLYVVNENGGGNIDHPQLWVYAPSSAPNQAPTAVAVSNPVNTIAENTTTASAIKVGDIVVTDDGKGTNVLTLVGTDAAFFEITNSSLYLKAGTVLDFETKSSYNVTVQVDDATLGNTPDASTTFTLTVTDVVNEGSGSSSVFISEVNPTGSSNGTYNADWFEVTNAGTTDLDITGWKMDDNSNGTNTSDRVALRGVTTIPAGKSAIFFEGAADGSTDATILANFCTAWFGTSTPPAGVLIGAYGGGSVGLSSGGDAVNLFDAAGNRVTGVAFGAATTNVTFDNKAGLGSATLPLPMVTTKSTNGVNGAFVSSNGAETGSPAATGRVFISEVNPTGSSNGTYNADWFEITNATAVPLNLTGWKMDDNSNGTNTSDRVALRGVTTIPAGKSAIFFEGAADGSTDATILANFCTAWFGTSTPPAGVLIGAYGGGSVGLSSGGDAVNLFDAAGNRVTGVAFGAATTNVTFDNKAGIGSATLPLPMITIKSANGVNGAFVSSNGAETGSPGITGRVVVTEVAPWSSSTSVGADWFEVMNTSAVTVDLTGWKMDDNTESPVAAVALNGVTTLEPGERAVFLETSTPSTTIPAFLTNWFGANPPASLKVGSYAGDGVGLSTGGDAVNLYNSNGVRQSGVSFGAAPSNPLATFENATGTPFVALSQLSVPGINGAFVAKNSADQIGSPGAVASSGPLDFNLWLSANNLSSTGFGSDSNGNGFKDGVEFFFNVKKPGDIKNLPKLTSLGGDKLLSFTTLNGISGVTGVLEHSDDLGVADAWTSAAAGTDYEVVTTTSANGQTTTTLRLLGNASSKFWRYRVTQ
ncbi:lamin tail domain-containing protein [Luteolibacter ambystomatis]|uniref:Lamin tail domain-containing protein n=1 Tax=Luteolibacter ambystomatis TaxID=2824561 RepID=A0A975J1X2_9BACT|nr:lamin tail domain-containing protein [Luteolibacter ambystomatis]QUE52522.1 lamin tail domain-containing protein [Luteolibacter ambystomatis]